MRKIYVLLCLCFLAVPLQAQHTAGAHKGVKIAPNLVEIGAATSENLTLSNDLILVGRAKVVNHERLPLLRGGGTATNEIIAGSQSVHFDADGEVAYATMGIPTRWDGMSDITLCGLVQNEIAEDDGDDISFTITVHGMQSGDTGTDAGQANAWTKNLTGGNEAINKLNEVSCTIDYDDATYPIIAGDSIVMKVVVNLGGAGECTGGLNVIYWKLCYTTNKIGEAQ